MCAYVRILLINVISTSSSALAVAGKELVEQHLKRHVLGHHVVFAQVVAAGGTGVHLRSERPLETRLGRECGRRDSHTDARTGVWSSDDYKRRCSVHTLQTLCEQTVVMGWKASSWQHTHMKICSILRRKFFL